VLLRNGHELDRLVGAVPESQIDAWLRRHVSVDAGAPA
jgi:thioredoxin-like negative regulator of GroEL